MTPDFSNYQDSALIYFLIAHRYTLLIPLAFLEGHIISLLVGFLARFGYFNPIIAGVLVGIGNLLGDIFLYWLGYLKGERFVRRFGRYVGLTNESVRWAKKVFRRRGSSILFLSKVTNGFGLAMAVLFTAGIARVPFRTFMFWNTLGECVWTGFLVSLGLFFGDLYTVFDSVAWRVGVIALAFLAVALLFRWLSFLYKSKRLS